MLMDRLRKDFLSTTGWSLSWDRNECVDSDGNFVPWYNYAVIDFLTEKLSKGSFRVFEYGCGYSTIFYAMRCAFVHSVETRLDWVSLVQEKARLLNLHNIRLNHLVEDFHLGLVEHYDIIVVDSVNRHECAMRAIGHIADNGIIIVDNLERQNLQKTLDMLCVENGFKVIVFSGLGPLKTTNSKTGIFYKSDNIFGI